MLTLYHLTHILQIRLLGKPSENEEIPSFEDIFGNEEDDEVIILYYTV